MYEDYLTVPGKMGQKIIECQETEMKEWAAFLKTLHDDYRLAKRGCANQPKIQFLRRVQIRNFCAMVEAQIHVWKLLTQTFHRLLRAELSDGEISILHEKA